VARRAFTLQQLVELLRRWQAGETLRRIPAQVGMSRNTVREYVRAAQTAGLTRDPDMTVAALTEFVRLHFPAAEDPGVRSTWRHELDAEREAIEQGLATNRVTTVWQRLYRAGKVKASLSTFRRYVRDRMPAPVDPGSVVVHGPEATPGEVAEVDFGRLGLWQDPRTGRRRVLWAFIIVLAYSRHMFVLPVLKMDKPTWLRCHVAAFAFFGGVMTRIVLDNLKDGVLKPDLYDPQLNRAYAEMGHHYGVLLDPTRILHPKDKPHVEKMVGYVREHLYRGREERFADLTAGAAFAEQWCRSEAGMRVHRITKRHPYEAFLEDELPVLRPLPELAWEPYTWEQTRVGADCYCTVGGGYYTVPYRLLHQHLDVRLGEQQVEFFHRADLVKVWPRVPRGRRQTDLNDFPPDRIAFYQRTPQWCLRRAAELGPGVHLVVQELLRVHTSAHLRQVHGILRLAEAHGTDRLDAACLRAHDHGDPRYLTVKNILNAGLERQPSQMHLLGRNTPPDTGAYLRGPAAYTSHADGVATGGEAGPTTP
jgi:transposase